MTILLCLLAAAADRPDVLVADFEGTTYGAWKTTGTAFGSGPARGTLPNQMHVDGFEGQGLVNSFHGGDKATGTLTSPPFALERRYLNFLVGGGGYKDKTCLNLLVAGKVVRTATGPNTDAGGSERLDWHTWDVADFLGQQATIQIVDNHTGGWGHINVDHIVQSDRKRQAEPAERTLTVTKPYLHLPIATGQRMRRVRFVVDGKTVREFDAEIAEGTPNFWAFADVRAFHDKPLTVAVDALPSGSKALDAISQSDDLKGEPLYTEKQRPQFHFTSRRGWLNDPNGLVYLKGEYHLFYQHNPYGWNWGNMHWGHAVSTDLVRWKELPLAIYPPKHGDWAFSGSAVVDKDNTAGFKTGSEDVLVAAFTSTGRGECIVFSNDRGRSWKEFAGNPVVKHQGRDPKLLWHAPTNRWVMSVYDEHEGKRWISFHTSPDLKTWTYASRIDGYFECPDLFELPVDGAAGTSKWVLYAADGKYALGSFDGRAFTPDGPKQTLWHGNFYAAQTFSDTPDGRRIQIGWGQNVAFPGMPFNQQMTVACRLTLKKTTDGVRLCAEPVEELATLRQATHVVTASKVGPGDDPLKDLAGELFDIVADVHVGTAESLALTLRGTPVVYDVKKGELSVGKVKAPLQAEGGRLRLRVLVDRGSVEAFADGGRVAVSAAALPKPEDRSLSLRVRGGPVEVKSMVVSTLKSAW